MRQMRNMPTNKNRYLKLKNSITKYIQSEHKLEGALVGMEVIEAMNGSHVFKHMSDIRLRPASNMKILTAVAALSVLGEDYTFTTDILIDGPIKEGCLLGDLYLKGKGDPTLLTSDLKILANKIKDAGINEIRGNIYGDDTWYDDVRLSQDMIWSDEHFYYGSQISALTVSPNADFDTGSIIVKVSPSEIGEKPTINVFPKTNYVEINNRAKTHTSGDEDDLIIYREHGTNKVIIDGYLSHSIEPIREWIAVWEPTHYTLDLFKNALKQENITLMGGLYKGATPEKSQLLYSHISKPLSDIIVPFMKLSNNGHGEILVKEMGKYMKNEGSWEQGLIVLSDELETFGVKKDTIIIRDGSGISHATLVPAEEIIKILYHIQKKSWFPSFLNSLPISGRDERMIGGTLRDRLKNFDVKAKTGTIYSVSTLSGYLKGQNNKDFIFSILLNNLIDEEDGPEILDHIVKLIVEHT